MIDASTGTSYGVEVLEQADTVLPGGIWTPRYGWFPKEDRTFIPPDPKQGGLERARYCAERARADGFEARVVRRDVTVQVVAG